jgi:hypothetical protein
MPEKRNRADLLKQIDVKAGRDLGATTGQFKAPDVMSTFEKEGVTEADARFFQRAGTKVKELMSPEQKKEYLRKRAQLERETMLREIRARRDKQFESVARAINPSLKKAKLDTLAHTPEAERIAQAKRDAKETIRFDTAAGRKK